MINEEYKWEPEDFQLKHNTVWSFPDRGNWATHNGRYKGNWSPYIPRNLILRYSNEGDTVLDQFAGSGTTLIEAKLLNRNCIGVDINPISLELCDSNTRFYHKNCGQVVIKKGDARNLFFLDDKSIDLICTHPPYSNIIKYSNDIPADLSRYEVKEFLVEMRNVASECYRVLKTNKFCAILMGDTRKNGYIVPLSFEVMKIFEAVGFRTKEIIIKEQHNCASTSFWKNQSKKYNFLLIAHEYLFVFKK